MMIKRAFVLAMVLAFGDHKTVRGGVCTAEWMVQVAEVFMGVRPMAGLGIL